MVASRWCERPKREKRSLSVTGELWFLVCLDDSLGRDTDELILLFEGLQSFKASTRTGVHSVPKVSEGW